MTASRREAYDCLPCLCGVPSDFDVRQITANDAVRLHNGLWVNDKDKGSLRSLVCGSAGPLQVYRLALPTSTMFWLPHRTEFLLTLLPDCYQQAKEEQDRRSRLTAGQCQCRVEGSWEINVESELRRSRCEQDEYWAISASAAGALEHRWVAEMARVRLARLSQLSSQAHRAPAEAEHADWSQLELTVSMYSSLA